MQDQYSRTQLLLGKEAMEKLHNSRVAVFGIGVMLVGYKAPTVGLVATVVMLVVASALFAMKARRNMQE